LHPARIRPVGDVALHVGVAVETHGAAAGALEGIQAQEGAEVGEVVAGGAEGGAGYDAALWCAGGALKYFAGSSELYILYKWRGGVLKIFRSKLSAHLKEGYRL
jgi:hypothetical protein